MKIYLDMVGCRLNQAEIERLARQFRAAGHEIVATASEADWAIINTCTVTGEAASDSRAALRRAWRAGARQVVATGCWVTLEPEAASRLPGVTYVIPNAQKDSLVADLLGVHSRVFDLEPLERVPLPGSRARTRAFIKVQDGCDNACTYCITRLARGRSRSRPIEAVLADAKAALKGGVKEIVLTGVHLGSWGQDLVADSESRPVAPLRLANLVSALLTQLPLLRLRLSSLEPWDVDQDFFLLWSDRRLCRHLHLPLQSGSATVLRRMARRITPESFASLIEAARSAIPEVAITTDTIVGFPGESETEFQETVEFVQAMEFAGGHVFAYSPRPGTPAARMEGQVPPDIKRERSAILRQIFAESALRYRQQFIGRTMTVLWESAHSVNEKEWRLSGLTDNYIQVSASASQCRWNQMDKVRITALEEGKLEGQVVTPT